MDSKNKARLIAPYIDWKLRTSDPTEEELGRDFDKLYDKSEIELNVIYNIYKKKIDNLDYVSNQKEKD